MGKVKVVNNNLNSNLNGTNFNNTPSETIFSFGRFSVTSNFDKREHVDYSTQLSTFVNPVTLETMGISDIQSEILYNYSTNAVLNLDKSDLKTFVKFGSAYEFLRVSIENIILKYPGSLFLSSKVAQFGNYTISDFSYDLVTNTSIFKIPINSIINKFNLIYNYVNLTGTTNESKDLNISYNNYIVWSSIDSENNNHTVIGYTGNTSGQQYLTVKVIGNPFPTITGTTGYIDFHIKPNSNIFEEFRAQLNEYEKYLISQRNGVTGFKCTMKDPTLLDDGNVVYVDTTILWTTADQYNIDIDTPNYRKFLEIILTIGSKYDSIKTDLIARFLTPQSIKTYDLTDRGKVTKLLRIYGREFDELRQFIDSLVYINKVTYNKINNAPDQIIKNLAKTFGWDHFSLVNETELVDSILSIDDQERNLNTDLIPVEIDIELWRRIIINTSYFWKSKGTREAIKSIFLIIGIPEPFINITEYIYTVEGKINPNTVPLTTTDFPSNSLPYDTEGYPIAPIETNNFYFQMSGNTDSGQAYLDVFRLAGFNLLQTIDNKKSWIQTGATIRQHYLTPQYYQEDSKLVINTKEIDVSLDVARGIEYDVYQYIKNVDFPANSAGYVLSYNYVNISLGVGTQQNTFTIPFKSEGDIEVRFNGILLNAPKTGTTTGITYQADYMISGNSIVLANGIYARNVGNRRDVVQITQLYTGSTATPLSGITVQYMVTRINASMSGTVIPLPTYASGDVQLTVNGISLTKGTGQFNADYIVDPNNTNQLIIQNPEVISYLAVNPMIQVAYVTVSGNTTIAARSEVLRIDSFNSGKIYYNNSANKYVYKLNYKLNNANEVKILIDGIGLEPNTDYTLNTGNPYEIYLPRGLKYGSVISAYYLIGGTDYFAPVIGESFGIGDISQLSFLEFLILMEQRMINATNRKTVTDSKGGWYPTLLRVYIDYLNRSKLPLSDSLHSNGYTFENLYPFLSKYNAFFQRFIDQLLSATIILRKSGLLVRNSIFTKQKFTYKRGVNMGAIVSRTSDGYTVFEEDSNLFYFGDDGSIFLKRPLSKNIEWTEDNVKIVNLCTNFIVSGITITYPVTTTTTTATPFSSTIMLYQTNFIQNSINSNKGIYRLVEYNLRFNPDIPPSYAVTFNLNFEIILSGLTNPTYGEHTAKITIRKNSTQIGNVILYQNDGTYYLTGTTVTVINSESLFIVLENTATANGINPISSKTILTPMVSNVAPSMGEFTIIPPYVETIPINVP